MGKGEGKGKETVAFARGPRTQRMQCGCCCFWALLPPCLIIFGIVGLCYPNTRVANIVKYNDLATQWNNHGKSEFMNETFTLYADDISYPLHQKTEGSSKYWPIYDTCQAEDDPEGGCTPTTPYSYATYNIELEDTNYISLQYNKKEVVKRKVVNKLVTIYTENDLDCADDTYYCRSYCTSKGGVWNAYTYLCTVTSYLSDICFRVRKNGVNYIPDIPPQISHNGKNDDYGCYYNGGSWSPYLFGSLSKRTVPITVRSYLDPVISASDCTQGCSDKSSTSSNCFGMTKNQQIYMFLICLFAGLIGLGIEVLIVFLMYLCCKNTIMNKYFRKQNTTTLAYPVGTIPYATQVAPVYQSYTVNQPLYAQPV